MTEIKLKSWEPVIIFNCIVAPIILFCFLMILSGRVTVILKGYAVDSSDNLYIGKEHSIEVYKEQKLINNIPIQYTDYAFTIKNGQEIVLSANNNTYYLDLQGNETRKEKDTQTYSAICRINHFESEKGDVYTKSNMLGYYRIIRNHGEVVYSMPVFDYLVLVTMILAFLSIVVFAFILVLKNLKYWV